MDNKKEYIEDEVELRETQVSQGKENVTEPQSATMQDAQAGATGTATMQDAQAGAYAAGTMPAAGGAAMPASGTAAYGKGSLWGNKTVTRKFLAIALAISLALNVVLTAGAMKLLGPGKGFDKGRFGRPGNEQQFDNHGRGNMMPPAGGQQPGNQPGNQQNQQPDDQQNENQQNQKSDDNSSSDQKSA